LIFIIVDDLLVELQKLCNVTFLSLNLIMILFLAVTKLQLKQPADSVIKFKENLVVMGLFLFL